MTLWRKCQQVVAVEARAGYSMLKLCRRRRGHLGTCRSKP